MVRKIARKKLWFSCLTGASGINCTGSFSTNVKSQNLKLREVNSIIARSSKACLNSKRPMQKDSRFIFNGVCFLFRFR